jgi:hypothetical protein
MFRRITANIIAKFRSGDSQLRPRGDNGHQGGSNINTEVKDLSSRIAYDAMNPADEVRKELNKLMRKNIITGWVKIDDKHLHIFVNPQADPDIDAVILSMMRQHGIDVKIERQLITLM